MQPPRHALGALLLERGMVEEAEAVYKADLGLIGEVSRAAQHPNNIWSLHGYNECLRQQGPRHISLTVSVIVYNLLQLDYCIPVSYISTWSHPETVLTFVQESRIPVSRWRWGTQKPVLTLGSVHLAFAVGHSTSPFPFHICTEWKSLFSLYDMFDSYFWCAFPRVPVVRCNECKM